MDRCRPGHRRHHRHRRLVKPRIVAAELGSFDWAIAAWTICGILAFFGTMALAELAALFPSAGGNYVYLRKAYGPSGVSSGAGSSSGSCVPAPSPPSPGSPPKPFSLASSSSHRPRRPADLRPLRLARPRHRPDAHQRRRPELGRLHPEPHDLAQDRHADHHHSAPVRPQPGPTRVTQHPHHEGNQPLCRPRRRNGCDPLGLQGLGRPRLPRRGRQGTPA